MLGTALEHYRHNRLLSSALGLHYVIKRYIFVVKKKKKKKEKKEEEEKKKEKNDNNNNNDDDVEEGSLTYC